MLASQKYHHLLPFVYGDHVIPLRGLVGNMLAWQVQFHARGIHRDLDDHYNGDPMSLDPIPSGTLKNLGDVDIRSSPSPGQNHRSN